MKWKRMEWTTKGADPTTVVEWNSDAGWNLMEFQGVVQVAKIGPTGARYGYPRNSHEAELGTELHEALERAHHAEERLQEAKYNSEDDYPN